jgi:hypothetical protein
MGNLMDFVSSEGPYLHSEGYHFRADVSKRIKGGEAESVLANIQDSVKQLESVSKSLKRQSDDFLAEWNGDYKKAS